MPGKQATAGADENYRPGHFEHTFEGIFEGEKIKWLAMCAYEFSEGKIQRLTTVNDRLSILEQAAKGWLEETVINSLVKRAEKGLH